MIGIICPDNNFELLTSRLVVDDQETAGDVKILIGRFNGTEVVLAMSKKGRMAEAGTILFTRFEIDCMIQIDLAVPLVPYLQQGDIVITENVLQYPENLLVAESDTQKIPVTMVEIAGDLVLARKIKDSYDINFAGKSNRPELIIGTVVTSSQLLSSRRVIASLQRDFGAVALDREGLAVGGVCRKHDCPFLGIRVVTENLSDNSLSSSAIVMETTMDNLLLIIEFATTVPMLSPVV